MHRRIVGIVLTTIAPPAPLMDRKLFAFAGLEPTGVADSSGDRACDEDDDDDEPALVARLPAVKLP